MSIHMKKGKKRTEGFTLVELICVIAILGILVAIAVPSYRGIQDKSAEQVAISNARSNYTLGKAQQDMLDAGVIKESEKEEYHFEKPFMTAIPGRARLSLEIKSYMWYNEPLSEAYGGKHKI